MPSAQLEELRSTILSSPLLYPILREWEKLELPDCWLTAGSIAQTVWNRTFALPPTHGISDIDIVYFDPSDLSERAEAQHTARILDAFARLPVRIDLKNEARVHLWYEAKFGYPITPYTSSADSITTFPTTATAIGLQPHPNGLRVNAPYGIDDLMSSIVRPNKKQITHEIYEAKTKRWIALWPKLRIVDWDVEDRRKP